MPKRYLKAGHLLIHGRFVKSQGLPSSLDGRRPFCIDANNDLVARDEAEQLNDDDDVDWGNGEAATWGFVEHQKAWKGSID